MYLHANAKLELAGRFALAPCRPRPLMPSTRPNERRTAALNSRQLRTSVPRAVVGA